MSSTERLEIVGLTHNIAGGGQGHGQPEREVGGDQSVVPFHSAAHLTHHHHTPILCHPKHWSFLEDISDKTEN